jgi:hypothetical protein
METQMKAKDEPATPLRENAPKAPDKGKAIDDFFAAEDNPTSLKDFMSHMSDPVEDMAPPPGFEEAEEPGEELTEEDREMAAYLDYEEEHEMTAFLILSNIDRMMAFIFSLISGDEMDKYRRRGNQLKGSEKDMELQVAAALVKKYQMRMSLEWMFATAFVMGYGPIAAKAFSDRQRILKQKEQERRQQEARDKFNIIQQQ